MSEKILTVGVPVYNMEKYLARCLDSVTSISNLDKVEIIVVNDGSKDASLSIAREYEVKYPQSVKVIDKPNGGWGTAINRSIAEATGKYYKSLDSDDWFDSDNFERYVELLETIDDDMVLTSFNEVNESGDVTRRDYSGNAVDKNLEFTEYLELVEGKLYAPIHALTYRTKLLRDNNIKIWERFYGDLDYINTPLVYVNSIYVSTLNIYQYFIGREGQSISIEGYKKHIDDYLAVAKKLISINSGVAMSNILKSIMDYDTFRRALWGYKLLMYPAYLGKSDCSFGKLKEFDSYIKSQHPILYKKLGKYRGKGILPYIYIWRKLGVNILKFI